MNLFYGILFFFLAHGAAFLQLNGQFKWEWFAKHEWVLALFGVPMSFFYIWGTKYAVSGMGGLLWPARFIGFGVGMLQYAVFVNYHFSEGITLKTWVSLVLCVSLIGIQVLWK